MSKIERIITFIDVVEANGFAAAARKQKISTAAISRQISNLEAELGAQLLQRNTRLLKLTEVGGQYYQHCKQIIHGLAEAEAAIAGSKLEATGTIRIASGLFFAKKFLVPYLPEFMELTPKLKIQLELAERFPDFSQENIDVLFGVSLDGPPDLVRKYFLTTRYVLCASSSYLEKYGIPRKPADLTSHAYICHSTRPHDNILTFANGVEVAIEQKLVMNDTSAMYECALQGMGIVKLHDYMVETALQEKKLIEILPKYQEPSFPVYLYFQSSRYLQPKIRRFIDFYNDKIQQNYLDSNAKS